MKKAALFLCVYTLGLVTPAVSWSQGDASLVDNRIALFPVVYAEEGEPLIGAHLPDIISGLKRIWIGDVLTQDALEDALNSNFVNRIDTQRLERLEATIKKAEERFHSASPEQAITLLEGVVSNADGDLAHVSADPQRAHLLLKAHLLLWWALSTVGEVDRLPALMTSTVERFPAAVVDTTLMPPHVADAFVQAKATFNKESVTVTVTLEGTRGGDCRLEVNGSRIGDGRSGAVAAKPGRSYYVVGRCDDAVSPPRRVVAQAPMSVRLDMGLTRGLRQTSAGPTLLLPSGPNAVSDTVKMGQAAGRLLGAKQVVLVSLFADVDGQMVMQFDRIAVSDSERSCAVRLTGSGDVGRADIDMALRAVREKKPATNNKMTFAEGDNDYLSTGDYVDRKLDEKPVDVMWTLLTSGLSGSLLISAGIFEVFAFLSQQDLDDCVSSITCRGTEDAEALRNTLNDELVFRDVLYLSAGVVAVGAAVVYFVVDKPSSDEFLSRGAPGRDGAWSIAPWVGAGGGGLNVRVSWD